MRLGSSARLALKAITTAIEAATSDRRISRAELIALLEEVETHSEAQREACAEDERREADS